MAAHRYWRLYSPNRVADNTYHGLGEVEFRIAAGGADQTSPGAAAASATESSFQIAGTEGKEAFDDSIVMGGSGNFNWWQSADASLGYQAWLKWDFGAGNAKDIIEVAIYPNLDGLARTPRMFLVQYSDDNAAWVTSWVITTTWPAFAWQTFTKPTFADGNATKWAIGITASQRAYGTVNQVAGCAAYLEWRDGAGVKISTGGTPFELAHSGTDVAANAYDADNATFWAAADTGFGLIGYQFASAVRPRSVLWRARNDGLYDQAAAAGFLLRTVDQIVWDPVETFSGVAWSGAASENELFVTVLTTGPGRRMSFM